MPVLYLCTLYKKVNVLYCTLDGTKKIVYIRLHPGTKKGHWRVQSGKNGKEEGTYIRGTCTMAVKRGTDTRYKEGRVHK